MALLTSCAVSADRGPDETTGQSRDAITTTNGIAMNGIAMNGIAMNGIAMNGIAMNGIAMNGIAMNGFQLNGIQTNGIAMNGVIVNGIAMNGAIVNGIAMNGVWVNGIAMNGVSANGVWPNGIAMNGIAMNGIAMNGLYINGLGLNGVGIDGVGQNQIGEDGLGTGGIVISGIGFREIGPDAIGANGTGTAGADLRGIGINGFYVHGQGEGGLGVDGTGLRDLGLDGLRVNGAGGLQVIGSGDAGLEDLAPAREVVLEVALHHLVGCALPAGETATITGADGVARVYHGVRGFAPEWQSGALSQAGEERVRACLESSPAATFGLGLNAAQEATITKLLTYMVQCALPEGESATLYAGDGTPKLLAGALGLAPEWRDGPLSAEGEHEVSACLAARSNALGQTVSLSLRHPDVYVSEVEADVFTTHEGAFWGNLFTSPGRIEACLVDGGGLSGRVCAESDACGFLVVGDCAEVCDSYDPVNGYSHCGEEKTAAVVNTFLNLGSRLSFGQGQLCSLDDGTLSCWGENRHGQLGDGTTEDRSAPVAVSQLGDQVAEAAIDAHACARQHDGSLLCWGRNDAGQVGDGSDIDRRGPVHVADDVASFAIGERHTCGVRTDGSLLCWGSNLHGQLGTGDGAREHAEPTPVTALSSGVARLASGAAARHTCALTADGSAWCWGANDHGQLGDGTREAHDIPVQVAVDEDGNTFGEVTDMCASRQQTCARKADGTMWCWGLDGATRPRHVASGAAPGGLACGEMHACFVREVDATVWCLGANTHGQLGRDTERPFTMTPAPVVGLDAVSHVNAGRNHTCATRVDGTLLCWGRDASLSALLSTELSSTSTPIDLASL